MNNIMDQFVEIKFKQDEDFLKIKETLTRIGIASKKSNTLTQSCHILHKQGRYWILSFKEMFILDGKKSTFSDEDRARRNTIIKLLEEWELLTVINKDKVKSPLLPISQIKVIPFKEKKDWTLTSKYTIGQKKENFNK